MQVAFSCLPKTLDQIETAFSPARLARIGTADRQLALRTYVWNVCLCQEMHLPLQTAEVVVRNALARAVLQEFGKGWYSAAKFAAILPERYKRELQQLVQEEQLPRADRFTHNHVIAGLKFGFWVHLLTKSYDKWLWANGLSAPFPNISHNVSREDAHNRVDQLRLFRNKIAHHYAIFDRGPLREYGNALSIIGWVCQDTAWFVRTLVNPQSVMGERPK